MRIDGHGRYRRAIPLTLVLGGLVILGLVRTAPGGQSGAKPPGANYQGSAFTFTKIQNDVYHAIGTGALSVGCNSAVIINRDDVVVVDSHISPAAAWALVEEVKTLTSKPVRYVVNTHFHFDHAHGNQTFPPDVEIIGHEYTRTMLASGRSKTGASYEALIGGLPALIADLRQQIAVSTAPAERAKLEQRLAIQEHYRQATDAVVATPPTATLNQSMTLFRGGREIRLLYLGRGHTGGDVVVFLPRERLIITGDLLTAGLAYLGDGYVPEWIETLEKLKALEFDTVLPGHGQAFKGKAQVENFQAYLRDFWSQVEKQHKAGVSATEAAKRIDLRAHARHYSTISDVGVTPVGVVRAYQVLDGTAQ